MKMTLKSKGFTLMELMVVIAIVGVLAATAFPSYNNYIIKSKRAVARGVVMDLVNRQEQYFANNKSYSSALSGLGGLPDPYYINGSGEQVSSNGVYQITVEVSGSAPYFAYTLKAAPVSGSTQASDACGTLSLTSEGLRSADTSNCW